MFITIPDDILNKIINESKESNVLIQFNPNLSKYIFKFFRKLIRCNYELIADQYEYILAYLFGKSFIINNLDVTIEPMELTEVYPGCLSNNNNDYSENVCCINCTNCTDCLMCINCSSCSHNNHCEDCSSNTCCNNCINCQYCSYCNNVDNSISCSYCNKCSRCCGCEYSNMIIDCKNCTACNESEMLTNCNYCSTCNKCIDCERCTMCSDSLLLNQCIRVSKSYTCNNCYKCKFLYNCRGVDNINGSNILHYSDHNFITGSIAGVKVKYHSYSNDIKYGSLYKGDKLIFEGSFKIIDNIIYMIYGKLFTDKVYHGLIGRYIKNGELNHAKRKIIIGSIIEHSVKNIRLFN